MEYFFNRKITLHVPVRCHTVQFPATAIAYMPRKGWKALPPRNHDPVLSFPLDYAVITDTQSTGQCFSTDDCCVNIKTIQQLAFAGTGVFTWDPCAGRESVTL